MNKNNVMIHIFECEHVWRNENVPKECPVCKLEAEAERLQKCYDVTNQSWRELKAQLEVTEKALALACDHIALTHPLSCETSKTWGEKFLQQSKTGDADG